MRCVSEDSGFQGFWTNAAAQCFCVPNCDNTEILLSAHAWEITPVEKDMTSCKCHSGGDLVDDTFTNDALSTLYTLDAGKTNPLWKNSLFYRRNEKNPFVCNTESYSNYNTFGDDCVCDNDDVPLKEMRPFRLKDLQQRSRTFGDSIPGNTFMEKLQNCAQSCVDKTDLSPFRNGQWDPEFLTDRTANALQISGEECFCYNIDEVEFTTPSQVDLVKTYAIVPGCSCAGKFYRFADSGTVKEDCPKGSYNMDACRSSCTLCPMGYFSAATGAAECEICPKGYFQDAMGQTSCRGCKNTCPTGEALNGVGVLEECPEGSVADKTVCAPCDGDHPDPVYGDLPDPPPNDPTAKNLGPCEGDCDTNQCMVGFTCYERDPGDPNPRGCRGEAVWNNDYCVANVFMNGIKQIPKPTAADNTANSVSYLKHSTDTFLVFRKGTFSGNSIVLNRPTRCSACVAGQYLKDGSCRACPAGYFGTAPVLTSCKECTAGKYQNAVQQTTCKVCASGQYQIESAQPLCKSCPAGFAREAYYPNNLGKIMRSQSITQECLPCGSVHGKIFKWDDLGWKSGVADYSSTTPPAPGCVFCNQYQDQVGQQTCKRCNRFDLTFENGKYIPYSYQAPDGDTNKPQACKYIQSVHFGLVRKRSMDVRLSETCTKEPDLKDIEIATVCLYRNDRTGAVFTRRQSPYKTFRDRWNQGSTRNGGFYATIQAYYTNTPCKSNFLDYYVNKRSKEGAECKDDMTYSEQQYLAYTLQPYFDQHSFREAANEKIIEVAEDLNNDFGWLYSIFRL